jgi:large subunit ribosomal protein L6
MPVPLVSGVELKVEAGQVSVKGPRGTLMEKLAPQTQLEVGDTQIVISRADDSKRAKAAHGLMRSLVANMVVGVTDGFSKTLTLVGVGYRAEVSEKQVKLSVGYSHPVVLEVPEGLEVKGESPTRIVVSGASKQKVGQFAADLRRVRPPEPYKGKGIRYADEHIRRKVGKAAAGGGG